MNSWQGTLSGSLCIAALVAAGVWHADDPEMQGCPLLSLHAAATAQAELPQFAVSRIYWSADGRGILSLARGEFDAVARLALHETAEMGGLMPVNTVEDTIACATLAPDGLHVLFGTLYGRLIWMDLQSAEPITLFESPAPDYFTSVAIADDGQRAAGATHTGSIYLSDPAGQYCMIARTDRESAIAEVSFSSDEKQLVSAHHDGTVNVWDLATGEVQELTGHEQPVKAAALLPDGNRIISAGLDDTIRVWDRASGHELWRAHLGLFGVTSMAVSPDGATAACGGYNRKIIVLDLQRGEIKFDIRTPASIVFHLSFSPDGESLAAAGTEGTIRLYDAHTGIERKGIEVITTLETARSKL